MTVFAPFYQGVVVQDRDQKSITMCTTFPSPRDTRLLIASPRGKTAYLGNKYNSQKTTLNYIKGMSAMVNLRKDNLNKLSIILACLLLLAVSSLPQNLVHAANDTYEITFEPPVNGTITVDGITNPVGPQTYLNPSPISIIATPAPGYSFASWTATPSNVANINSPTNPSTTMTPTGNGTVTATFSKNTYIISTSIFPTSAAGTVTPNATGPYNYGDTVVLTETANSGYTFSTWGGDGVRHRNYANGLN